MFTVNGLNFWTAIMQEAVVDLLTRAMGEVNFLGSHKQMADVLDSRYGIAKKDFEMLQAYRSDVEGHYRLSPDMFEMEHPDLANKFRFFLEDWIRQAVIEPDATSQVWVRMGLRDGTPLGSTVRLATQYMSFGMATYRKTYMRMMNAYGDQGFLEIFKDPTSRRRMDAMWFVAWSLALGYVAMTIKDILRGREPVHPFNFNKNNAKKWLYQSGVAGPLSDLFYARDTGDIGDILLGPSLGGIKEIGDEILQGDISGTLYRIERNAPFATLPIAGEMRKRLLSVFFQDAYVSSQRAVENLFDQKVFFFNPESDDQ